ncbi:GGDEF domain-containing protein [Quatrionicoccus australiensis]|uniref:GGDEF domain-containing protein n=1 Tax=Quatrionicoccus australiensis TaxID=138118 RepID=UPI001CF81874|nr:GGDEF domain-containing protein [Quatrionicoccus australiensis]
MLVLLVLAGLCFALYANLGLAKPPALWKWMDIVGEGGTAIMAGIWTLLILGSRPSGRVTSLLAGGLAAIMLGAWVDCLDEFFAIPHDQYWDNLLESLLTPGGMLTLTIGLYYWRQEQWSLNEHMQKRERLFREHRSFDRITQLANADYLRRQLRLEQKRQPQQSCALILLDLDNFHQISRAHGAGEGDRLLQAVSHLLLLNLRADDLLCRYAGDRFAILLPGATPAEASALAQHLEKAIASLAHHTRHGQRLDLSARTTWGIPDCDEESFLSKLNRNLESLASQRDSGLANA